MVLVCLRQEQCCTVLVHRILPSKPTAKHNVCCVPVPGEIFSSQDKDYFAGYGSL